MITLFILLVIAYLVGSIPTGFLFCRYFFNLDITKHGSGNIGASNVARVLGKKYFLIIFLIDAFKAWVVVSGGMFLCSIAACSLAATHVGYLLAFAVLIGNAYSVFLNFGGGKGVASTVGIIAALLPQLFVVCFMGCWLLMWVITKQPFIASLMALCIVMVGNYYWPTDVSMMFLGAVWLWVVMRHCSNLRAWYTLQVRLLANTR